MNAIDDEELLDRIRGAYAGEALRVPLTEVKGARPRWRPILAGVCAVAVAGGLVLVDRRPWSADPAQSAQERCGAEVVQATRDSAELPGAERGRVPATRMGVVVGEDRVFLYRTGHALITCVASATAVAVTVWVVPDGEPLPPHKLEPRTWSVDERLSWVGGTATDVDGQQLEVELPSGRRVAGVTQGGAFLAAWTGEAARPVRVTVWMDGGTSSWGR